MDPSERLDQLAETAHRKKMRDIFDRFPHRDTVEGHALVGKVRAALKSRRAGGDTDSPPS